MRISILKFIEQEKFLECGRLYCRGGLCAGGKTTTTGSRVLLPPKDTVIQRQKQLKVSTERLEMLECAEQRNQKHATY